jgi:hypothetical protein
MMDDRRGGGRPGERLDHQLPSRQTQIDELWNMRLRPNGMQRDAGRPVGQWSDEMDREEHMGD